MTHESYYTLVSDEYNSLLLKEWLFSNSLQCDVKVKNLIIEDGGTYRCLEYFPQLHIINTHIHT